MMSQENGIPTIFTRASSEYGRKTPTPSVEERNVRLLNYLGISAHDVSMNQQGRLSDTQHHQFQSMVKEGRHTTLIIAPLILIISIVIAGIQIHNEGILDNFEGNILWIVFGLGGSFLLYIIGVGYALWRSRRDSQRDLDDLTIHSLEGKLKVGSTDMGTTILKFGRKKIYIRHPQADKAFVSNTPYRVYFYKAYRIRYFVSAEAIE